MVRIIQTLDVSRNPVNKRMYYDDEEEYDKGGS
jgi:hypothetical protein